MFLLNKSVVLFFLNALMLPVFAYDNEAMEKFSYTSICLECDLNSACLSLVYENCELRNPGREPATPLLFDQHAQGILQGSYLYDATIEKLDFSWVHMPYLTGSHMAIYDTNLDYANLAYSDMPNFKLRNQHPIKSVSFLGANMESSDLVGQRFYYAIFDGVDFSYANLSKAEFFNTLFIGTRFDKANLSGVIFSGGDLTRAKFSDADLSFADLSTVYVESLPDLMSELAKAKTVCGAYLPDGGVGPC